jgi:hypothetical protein
MAGKNNSHVIVWDILGVLVVGYIALKILPGLFRGFGGGSGSGNYAGTYGSSATGMLPYTYRSANGNFQTSGDAGSIIGALVKALTGSKTASKPLPNLGPGGGGSQLPFAGLIQHPFGPEKPMDPGSGIFSGWDTPGLDGIQLPYESLQTLDNLPTQPLGTGWDTSNGIDWSGIAAYGNSGLDSIQIPQDTSGLQTLDNLPTTDVGTSGDSSSTAYYQPPSDYYMDPTSYDGGGYGF